MSDEAEGHSEEPADTSPVDLLHPFYLDTDMSMAFAAALAGGVALAREDVEREQHESEAVRNLRGNVRLFGGLGPVGGAGKLSGERERTEGESAELESRLVRHHTEASIFIALHDELRRQGRLRENLDSAIAPGELVSLKVGPAVAPLRRLVDQVIRLLDVAAPTLGLDLDDGARAHQRQRAKGKHVSSAPGNEGDPVQSLRALRSLMVSLLEDLDRSGMLDVVIRQAEGPNIVLTLDKRFVDEQSLEILHTAHFTVVGKVTQVWAEDGEFVNLYRRSVLSLAPALTQTVAWNMLALLATVAGSFDAEAAERAAYTAARIAHPQSAAEPGEQAAAEGETAAPEIADAEETPAASGPDEPEQPEVLLGDVAFQAVSPALDAPAIQVLPLAICA